jgi:uncharacterized glyoxalase superfamily protein PhnB
MSPGWGTIPSVRVADMPSAFRFYTGVLAFDVERGGPDDSNVALKHGDARIMLETAADHYGDEYNAAIRQRMGNRSPHALYVEAADLDALQVRVRSSDARVVDPLADRPWGQREFTVEDPEGNWITFWQADTAEE